MITGTGRGPGPVGSGLGLGPGSEAAEGTRPGAARAAAAAVSLRCRRHRLPPQVAALRGPWWRQAGPSDRAEDQEVQRGARRVRGEGLCRGLRPQGGRLNQAGFGQEPQEEVVLKHFDVKGGPPNLSIVIYLPANPRQKRFCAREPHKRSMLKMSE